jgi:hypothetical protein
MWRGATLPDPVNKRGNSRTMSKLSRSISVFAALALTQLFFAPASSAVTLNFGCITNNNASNCAIGEAQLSVEVTDIGGGQVQFDFMNAGPTASSITDVYFDDGTLLGIATLIDMDDGVGGDMGVDFTEDAAPPNLPGGNLVGFQVTAGFLADSDPPVQANGVNPNEWLGVVFNLAGGGTFADILLELENGDLRLGIHLQSIDTNGGSESFVNLPIPEPGTALLMGLGLAALGLRKR